MSFVRHHGLGRGRRAGGQPKGAITRPEGTIPTSGYSDAGLHCFDQGQTAKDFFSALRDALFLAHLVNGASPLDGGRT
jgi:hypothetical protein